MLQAGAVKSMNVADIKSNYKCPYVDGTRCRFSYLSLLTFQVPRRIGGDGEV